MSNEQIIAAIAVVCLIAVFGFWMGHEAGRAIGNERLKALLEGLQEAPHLAKAKAETLRDVGKRIRAETDAAYWAEERAKAKAAHADFLQRTWRGD